MTLTPRLALLLTAPPLLWVGNAVVGRAVRDAIPPMTLNALRWGLAFLLLAPLARRLLPDPRPALARWRGSALLGTAPAWHHGLAFALIVAGIVVLAR